MDTKDRKIKEEEIARHKRNAKCTLFFGIVFVCFAPYLFTRMSRWDWANFTHLGQVGDTIGGLTSPIVNLISAIIIYLSFQQQLLANEIQISMLNSEKLKDEVQIEKDALRFHYSEIKDSIRSLKFQSSTMQKETYPTYSGVEAIENFISEYSILPERRNSSTYNLIRSILIDIETYIDQCKNSQVLEDGEKDYFLYRMTIFYMQNVFIPIKPIISIEKNSKSQEILAKINSISKSLDLLEIEIDNVINK